jgi:hypothetical protein
MSGTGLSLCFWTQPHEQDQRLDRAQLFRSKKAESLVLGFVLELRPSGAETAVVSDASRNPHPGQPTTANPSTTVIAFTRLRSGVQVAVRPLLTRDFVI